MRILVAIATLLAAVLAQINTNISNGTCYFEAQSTAPSVFIPCGNVAAGNIACCGVGDTCLNNSACYNPPTGDTYRIGCTDPTYQNPSCPGKGNFSDHVWVGLTSYPTNRKQWVACNNTATTLTHGLPQECPTGPALFSDNPTLESSAILPSSTGLNITWFPGYSQITAHAAAASSTTAATTGSNAASSSSSQAQSSSSTVSTSQTLSSSPTGPTSVSTSAPTELSTAAKAGIGIGAFFAILSLSALIWCLVLSLRRHRRLNNQPVPPIEDQIRRRSHYGSPSPEKSTFTTTPANGGDLRSPAWSGHKSELSADGVGMISPVSANQENGVGAGGGTRSSGISAMGTNTSPQRHCRNQQQQEGSNGVHELPMNTSVRPGFYEMPA